MRTGNPKIIAVAAAFLALAGGLQAQPRPCLDVTADGIVNEVDVEIVHAAAAAMRSEADPRGDYNLLSGVTIDDAVNLQRVADGQQFALIDFLTKAAVCNEEVVIHVQNIQLLGTRGDVLVTVDGGAETATVTGSIDSRGIVFVMPDLQADLSGKTDIRRAYPGDLTGLALVTVSSLDGKVLSNACAVRVLPKGKSDGDGDGIPDDEDTCPSHFDPINADTDADGVGDLCDNCPGDPNALQEDGNGDGSGDACAPDDFVFINGQAVKPQPGIDPEIAKLPVPQPHVVLLLSRAKSPEIKQELLDAGVQVIEPLARHAFIVRGDKANLDKLAGFPWFHALFALKPSDRLGSGLEAEPASSKTEVTFQNDVGLDEAAALLEHLGAVVVAPGVDIVDGQGQLVQRVRTWQVELPEDGLSALADLDQVLTIDRDYPNRTGNATSRTAINVVQLNNGGLNGNGRNVGEWDQGWAAGDSVGLPGAPVVPPPLGPHPGLAPRVMARDHQQGFEGFNPPAGCNASIICNGFCAYLFHATHVGGTIAGNGNLVGGGAGPNRGMASLGTLRSYEWSDSNNEAVCERTDAISNFNTVSHNNSWGFVPQAGNQCAGTMGFYHSRSNAYDQSIRQNPQAAENFCTMNDQNVRNTLGVTCLMPPIFNPNACSATPPGVAPPAINPVPVLTTLRRFFTVEAPGGTAKSTTTVGNMDFLNNRLNNSSSMGPTQDGRLKPEVVAHGTSVVSTCVPGQAGCNAQGYATATGCSMATPAVTGATSLLFEHGINVGRPLQSESARALLVHTATDLGTHPNVGGTFLNFAGQWQAFAGADGPDFLTGYGLVNALGARNHITNGNLGGTLQPSGCPSAVPFGNIPFMSPVSIGGPGPVAGCPAQIWDVVWYVNIPAGFSQLKVTVSWNDPPAAAGANPTLINDLDLMLQAPNNGIYHYPWWLDPVCPWRQAVRVQNAAFNNALYSDHRNTLEQVHVVGGVQAGTWRVIVRSGGLAMGPQPFALMISAQ